MKVQIIGSEINQVIYDSVVSHPLQSWQWGEARKEMGREVLRIGEFQGKNLITAFQVSLHRIPFIPYSVGYVPRSSFPSSKILEWLIQYGSKHKVVFFKFEPNEKKNNIKHSNLNVIKSTHPLFPTWTQIIDLTQTEVKLLESMKTKTRYNIRLAEKKGVVIKEQSDNKGFEIFSQLYFETCKRQKYYGHNLAYHQTVWNHLKRNIAHILIAYYKDIPLASYELFYFNKTLYYPYGGTSLLYRNLMASNLLMWQAILFGKKIGATSFDMWGSLPKTYDKQHPWAGFTRFKEGYNAQFVEMAGSYDLIIHKLYYSIYSTANIIRSFFLSR